MTPLAGQQDLETPGERGPPGVPPGALSSLLQDLAHVPEALPSRPLPQPGTSIGRFELLRQIGSGGFGVVYEARDRELHRSVAFKLVRPGRLEAGADQLGREAEVIAQLSHPNLVTLFDVGRCDHGPYLVLELLRGETLEERRRRGPVTVAEAVRIAAEIARGLAHAHAQGVVHRDLKPSNVFLCQGGAVKLLDFGMSHAFGRRRVSGGTPAYMAPEQWRAAPEDERTDVYALGVMLFELLANELPFAADDRGKAVLSERRAPALDVPGLPALGALVARMLEKDPTRRPRDGGEVLDELSRVQRALEPEAAAPAEPVRTRRRPSRRIAAGIAAAALLAAAAGFVAFRRQAAEAPADDRVLVAVADFANETRDPDLDGLSGLLITSLEQSRKLRVLTRGRMTDLVRDAGGGDGRRIDESVARVAGRRAGVRTLLLASIQKLGNTYAAELRALDPQKDEYLFTLREQATTKDDLLPLIDRISDRTRLALHESDDEVKASEVKVAEAVTPSLEAYRHYFRGKELAARGLLHDAVAEFRRAVEIEPRFALAKLEIAWIGYFSGDASRVAARELVKEALRTSGRPPAKEGGLIRILAAFFDGRFAAARAEIRSVTARYPDDRDVMVLAAEVGAWSGDAEGALPHFERALRLAPDWDVLRLDQASTLSTVGRMGEALRLAEAAAKERATPTARAALGLARYANGDVEGGVAALQAAGAEGGPMARILLAQGLAALGRIAEALLAVASLEDPPGDVTRAQVLAYAGRLREGRAALERAARRPGVDLAFNRQMHAWYLAAAGDLAAAREAASQGDFFTHLDGAMLAAIGDDRRLGELVSQLEKDSFYGRFFRALAAHRAGERERALAELRALDAGTVSFVPYYRGLAAAEAGHDEEAVEAFRPFERPAYIGSDCNEAPWLLARARLLEARSLERLGRRGEARKVLDLQLVRWKDADPDLPLLAEMKALRAKL